MLRVVVSKPAPPRLLCFDLENRPLAYWYDGETTSEITAFGWKWSDGKRVITLLLQADGSFVDDAGVSLTPVQAYQTFTNELACAGLIYGHNIRQHDLPMLNAGLIRRGWPTLWPLMTTDTAKDLPRRKGLSYSLENMAAMYGLPGVKYRMTQPAWEEANRLTPAGTEQARKRVAGDVLLQERLYRKLTELNLLRPPRVWRP